MQFLELAVLLISEAEICSGWEKYTWRKISAVLILEKLLAQHGTKWCFIRLAVVYVSCTHVYLLSLTFHLRYHGSLTPSSHTEVRHKSHLTTIVKCTHSFIVLSIRSLRLKLHYCGFLITVHWYKESDSCYFQSFLYAFFYLLSLCIRQSYRELMVGVPLGSSHHCITLWCYSSGSEIVMESDPGDHAVYLTK